MVAVDDIRRVAAPILKKAGIRRAGLFGSVARGDARDDSDVDILIEHSQPYGLFELVHIKHLLEEALNRKVDVLDYRAIKPRMRSSIMTDEISIL